MNLRPSRAPSASDKHPAPSYFSYIYKPPDSPDSSLRCIILHESRMVIESGTTGLRTWSASLALAHWFFHHPGTTDVPLQLLFHLRFCSAEEVRDHNVLELGSGTGFLGIVIALLQIEHRGNVEGIGGLCLTDVDESVLQQCHRNIQLTQSKSFNSGFFRGTISSRVADGVSKHPNMRIRLLDWNDALDANPQGLFTDQGVHIITGADLVC